MMCSDTTSPRVSFSHDVGQAQADAVPRRDTTLLDMNSDFEFNLASSSSEQESCSADELFANGVILPVQFQRTSKQIKKCAAPPTVSLPPLPRPSNENSKKYFQVMEVNKDSEEKQPQSKSFWGFKRSSSLNCDAKKSLICSLSILSRSNSTGSLHNNKKSSMKDLQNKPGSQKLQASSSSSSSSSNYYSTSHPYQLQQKKKNYGTGVKISPVLNVPPPYISKGTANLFGLGSFLRSGGSKDKKNKK